MAPPPNHLIYTGNIYLHMPATVALAFFFDNILTDEKNQQPWMFFLFVFVLEKQKFILRAHIYQARSLIGSDASGLSG